MVAFTFSQVRTEVNIRLQDRGKFLQPSEVDGLIRSAVQQTSHDRKRYFTTDIPGDGTRDYALPTAFIKRFSEVLEVESPAGQDRPVFLDKDDDWFVYEDPDKPAGEQLRLRFRETTTKIGDDIRVRIATSWTLEPTSDVDDQDTFLAIVFKTLHSAYRSIAARFAQSTDPSIQADAVDYGGQGQNFLFLAEEAKKEYRAIVGLSGDVKAAAVLAEVDVIFAHGEDFLNHPVRTR